ncbi:MAG TPA: hypothetical protein VGN61_11590, partial [Verrucomicrobiae bacterium]
DYGRDELARAERQPVWDQPGFVMALNGIGVATPNNCHAWCELEQHHRYSSNEREHIDFDFIDFDKHRILPAETLK